ncbi:hypothetical protein THMIRHAM_18270 [Thiomicrorhabdus immobilis]|uniref:Uncharacterized protein n=1 Tax=Thiomicrorhabdus immobilis TaxID=2791037 RepID=A0ABN6CY55_9GAMM|nr:hypothetical protein THMIRHAM_18270 [Thiomicrorhabdus immobilis]
MASLDMVISMFVCVVLLFLNLFPENARKFATHRGSEIIVMQYSMRYQIYYFNKKAE